MADNNNINFVPEDVSRNLGQMAEDIEKNVDVLRGVDANTEIYDMAEKLIRGKIEDARKYAEESLSLLSGESEVEKAMKEHVDAYISGIGDIEKDLEGLKNDKTRTADDAKVVAESLNVESEALKGAAENTRNEAEGYLRDGHAEHLYLSKTGMSKLGIIRTCLVDMKIEKTRKEMDEAIREAYARCFTSEAYIGGAYNKMNGPIPTDIVFDVAYGEKIKNLSDRMTELLEKRERILEKHALTHLDKDFFLSEAKDIKSPGRTMGQALEKEAVIFAVPQDDKEVLDKIEAEFKLLKEHAEKINDPDYIRDETKKAMDEPAKRREEASRESPEHYAERYSETRKDLLKTEIEARIELSIRKMEVLADLSPERAYEGRFAGADGKDMTVNIMSHEGSDGSMEHHYYVNGEENALLKTKEMILEAVGEKGKDLQRLYELDKDLRKELDSAREYPFKEERTQDSHDEKTHEETVRESHEKGVEDQEKTSRAQEEAPVPKEEDRSEKTEELKEAAPAEAAPLPQAPTVDPKEEIVPEEVPEKPKTFGEVLAECPPYEPKEKMPDLNEKEELKSFDPSKVRSSLKRTEEQKRTETEKPRSEIAKEKGQKDLTDSLDDGPTR